MEGCRVIKYTREDMAHVGALFVEILANKENAKSLLDLHKNTKFTDVYSNYIFESSLKSISSKLTMSEKDYYGTYHNKIYGDYSTIYRGRKIYIDLKNSEDTTNSDYCGCISTSSLKENEDILYVCLNNRMDKIFITSRARINLALLEGDSSIHPKKGDNGEEFLGYIHYSKLLDEEDYYEFELDRR